MLPKSSIILTIFYILDYATSTKTISVDNNNFTITYHVSGSSITFDLSAKTKGWIGIGINPTAPQMKGSDLFVGNIASDGAPHAHDLYVEANASTHQPQVDPKQDWNIKGVSTSSHNDQVITIISVTRLLDTGDAKHDAKIENKTINLLWAYNKNTTDIKSMHTSRGFVSVNLLA